MVAAALYLLGALTLTLAFRERDAHPAEWVIVLAAVWPLSVTLLLAAAIINLLDAARGARRRDEQEPLTDEEVAEAVRYIRAKRRSGRDGQGGGGS